MSCSKSLSPTAENATVLYDFNDDSHNLWSRSNLTVPLPPCFSSSSSFSSPPPNCDCLVCFYQKMVFAICRNLTDGVKLTMEAGADWVNLTTSKCPKPLSDGDGDDGASKSQLLAIIIPVFLVVLLLIGVLLCIFRKDLLKFCRAIQGSRSQRPETEESEQSVALQQQDTLKGIC